MFAGKSFSVNFSSFLYKILQSRTKYMKQCKEMNQNWVGREGILVEMFVFRKIWRALFSCNTRFEIRPFTLLSMNCFSFKEHLGSGLRKL